MLTKAYLINFDKGEPYDYFDYTKFHNTLTTVKGVLNWWHYLQSSYIIVVDNTVTAKNVQEYIIQIMPNKYFFAVEINLKNHNGWLPQGAWEWINKYNNKSY
jgi:hypothetical protein